MILELRPLLSPISKASYSCQKKILSKFLSQYSTLSNPHKPHHQFELGAHRF